MVFNRSSEIRRGKSMYPWVLKSSWTLRWTLSKPITVWIHSKKIIVWCAFVGLHACLLPEYLMMCRIRLIGGHMSTIAEMWTEIETQYNNGTFPADQLDKINVLVFSDDIENIRNGLTLMTTIAPEYLCRYLEAGWRVGGPKGCR